MILLPMKGCGRNRLPLGRTDHSSSGGAMSDHPDHVRVAVEDLNASHAENTIPLRADRSRRRFSILKLSNGVASLTTGIDTPPPSEATNGCTGRVSPQDPANACPLSEDWVNPPSDGTRRGGHACSGHQSEHRTYRLAELADQFCDYMHQQRGKTEGGMRTYRWNLKQFMGFVKARTGRLARTGDLTVETIQGWMDDMAAAGLSINTLRCRLASLSSFCAWLVKRGRLAANPVDRMDRPPHKQVPPAVPTPHLMDAMVRAAKERGRMRDVALFLVLRYTAMRREAVARLRVLNLDGEWGFRAVRGKGDKVRDIPVPAPVMRFLHAYVETVLRPALQVLTPETPLFWSTWGRKSVGKIRRPMTGKNIWRLCKVYGRRLGVPKIKPHDFRHGVAMEVLGPRNNMEEVRALLDHTRLDTVQIYTTIRPPQLKKAVAFYDEAAAQLLEDAEDREPRDSS